LIPAEFGRITTAFTVIGHGDLLGFPMPAWIAAICYLLGSVCLNLTATGRYVLAIGGNEEAARLMGLPVDRVKLWLYLLSGLLAGLAGVILAAQFGGRTTHRRGRMGVVCNRVGRGGGTLLTGDQGSVGSTLAGVLLLGLIFNILNFENGLGWISLSAYWQSVIRGVFLMIVVVFQSRLVVRQRVTR
jgi:galactofuranose transport system permease protein